MGNKRLAHLLLQPMSAAQAAAVAHWRYSDQWSRYDLESAEPILKELGNYWSVVDGERDTLVGFYCLGSSARVAGLAEDPQLIDVGGGMSPQLVGQGNGEVFGRVVMDHLEHGLHHAASLRAVIQTWNTRSLRFAHRLGFVDSGELIIGHTDHVVQYRVLQRQSPG